jgi:hypothetical protein
MDNGTTIMCIQWKANRLGCSYYSSESLELFLMEDITESTRFEYTLMRNDLDESMGSKKH